MPGSTGRTVLAVLLIFHGLGHLMGVLPALGLFGAGSGTGPDWKKNWSSRSRLLSGRLGEPAVRILCAGLFLSAAAGFLAAGLGRGGWLVPFEAWRILAGISALVSLLAVALFWNALILLFPHKIGALGVSAVFLLIHVLAWAVGGGLPIPRTPGPGRRPAGGFTLSSPAFKNGDLMPGRFTCRGEELSPPLEWENVPGETRGFALVMEDLDTPIGVFPHWVLINIPKEKTGMEEGVSPGPSLADGTVQGRNGMRRNRYLGPCPPWGTHRYVFHIFALDIELAAGSEWGKKKLLKAISGHILARAHLTGVYSRTSR